jgi:hypothetical protein
MREVLVAIGKSVEEGSEQKAREWILRTLLSRGSAWIELLRGASSKEAP